jgi:hypothetical protein
MLDGGKQRAAAGVFTYPRTNGPSRLSIYSLHGGHWTRIGGLTSDEQIQLVATRGDNNSLLLGTLETYTRADGSESALKLWRLGDGFGRYEFADTKALQDVSQETTESTIVLTSSQFPTNFSSCTMCTRARYRVTLSAKDGKVAVLREALNPWVDVLDRFFGFISRDERDSARTLVADDSLLRVLADRDVEAEADTGDLVGGWGRADLTLGYGADSPRYWRATVVRDTSRKWIIERVVRGLWDERKQEVHYDSEPRAHGRAP